MDLIKYHRLRKHYKETDGSYDYFFLQEVVGDRLTIALSVNDNLSFGNNLLYQRFDVNVLYVEIIKEYALVKELMDSMNELQQNIIRELPLGSKERWTYLDIKFSVLENLMYDYLEIN